MSGDHPNGFTVPAGETWEIVGLVTTPRNVIVYGTLRMRPGAVLRFRDVDESAFVGGGMDPVASDVGLWIIGGRIDACGTRKTAWVRATQPIPAAATTVTLAEAPSGWEPGDELVIVPTGTNHLDYDYPTVAAISGNTVTLTSAATKPHPLVTVGPGMTLGAEVLNLTRDVRIEGTTSGRAHIFIRSPHPQSPCHTAIRYMGPRQPTSEGFTSDVLGRYGLHFHLCGDGSRGSLVDGVVIRDGGAHAYVAHESHGVTFQSCISHDTFDHAFWWDPREFIGAIPPRTNDNLYDACVASLVRTDPPFRGYTLAGFELGNGDNPRALDCVAVGVQGNKNAAGFAWPEGAGSVWDFDGCVSHNNKMHGVFVWQNINSPHDVANFVCYRNGQHGINHGAYRNGYLFRNAFLAHNGISGVFLHATSRNDVQLRFRQLHITGSPNAFLITKHTLDALAPTIIEGCDFFDHIQHAIRWSVTTATKPEWMNVVDCTHQGTGLISPTQPAGSNVTASFPGTSLRPAPFQVIGAAPLGG